MVSEFSTFLLVKVWLCSLISVAVINMTKPTYRSKFILAFCSRDEVPNSRRGMTAGGSGQEAEGSHRNHTQEADSRAGSWVRL